MGLSKTKKALPIKEKPFISSYPTRLGISLLSAFAEAMADNTTSLYSLIRNRFPLSREFVAVWTGLELNLKVSTSAIDYYSHTERWQ